MLHAGRILEKWGPVGNSRRRKGEWHREGSASPAVEVSAICPMKIFGKNRVENNSWQSPHEIASVELRMIVT